MALLDKFSIQLFSLKDEAEKDFARVLERVGELGFTGVEFAGYYGYGGKELRALIDKAGLESIGSHVGMDMIENNLADVIAYNKALGSKYIVIPGYNFTNREEAVEFAEKIKKAAPPIKEAGFGFAYHNHAHEFKKDGERYLLDILLDELNGVDFCLELDIYWAAYAGVDYMTYLKKNSGRIELLHIKQMADCESKTCSDLDSGVIDFKQLITEAKALGIEHFIIEQEEFEVGPWVSVGNGIKHIMNI